MIRRPPRSTHCISSAASDVYKRQPVNPATGLLVPWLLSVVGICIQFPGKPMPRIHCSGNDGRRIAVTDSVQDRGTSRRILPKTLVQSLIQSVVRLSSGHQDQSIGTQRLLLISVTARNPNLLALSLIHI